MACVQNTSFPYQEFHRSGRRRSCRSHDTSKGQTRLSMVSYDSTTAREADQHASDLRKVALTCIDVSDGHHIWMICLRRSARSAQLSAAPIRQRQSHSARARRMLTLCDATSLVVVTVQAAVVHQRPRLDHEGSASLDGRRCCARWRTALAGTTSGLGGWTMASRSLRARSPHAVPR